MQVKLHARPCIPRKQCARKQCAPPKQLAIQKRSLPADQKWRSVEETIKEIMSNTSLGTKEKRKHILLQMKWHDFCTPELSLLRDTVNTLNIALTAEKGSAD